MKRVRLKLVKIGVLVLLVSSISFKKINTNNYNYSTLSNSITIGTQTWMTKNLDVSYFRNGEKIPEARSFLDWEKADLNKKPAWCYYEFNINYGTLYGKLYNWYAVSDKRGLAPKGWKVATKQDWEILEDNFASTYNAGRELKSANGWEEASPGNNTSGFNGLPGGGVSLKDGFMDMRFMGYFWCSNEKNISEAYFYSLGPGLGLGWWLKGNGFSVRCIKGTN